MQKSEAKNHEEYHAQFDEDIREKLEKLNNIISKALPHAQKVISYQMPAFKTTEALIYYAAFKSHISIFPTPSGVEAFRKELGEYILSKGTIQIQNDQKMPLKLIAEIAKFRNEEVKEKNKAKSIKTTCRKGHVYNKGPECKTCPECEAMKSTANTVR
jgi:uncharacterized protein YdhG (YjbR/CyaY superfamily)